MSADESLVLSLRLEDDEFGGETERAKWFVLELLLSVVVRLTFCGEIDGNGVGEGYYEIFALGPSARRLWVVCLPWVWFFWPRRGSFATFHRFADGDRQRREIRT